MRVYRYIIGLMLVLFPVVLTPGVAQAFNDTRQHWAGLEIEHLQSREMITGYPNGSYRPESPISRQEFLVLLIRAMGKEKEAQVLQKGDSSFNDTANSWARGYIELAQELNIVQGDGQGRFAPLRLVNRQEAVTMLVKCLRGSASGAGTTELLDEDEISTWARPSVALALKSGLVHGFPDNTFQPRRNLTRAEVAILLESFLKIQGEQYQICGTITKIDLRLGKVTAIIADREENFEVASNLAVWNMEKRQPQSELSVPMSAYMDLNSNGKLSFILSTQNIMNKINLKTNRLVEQKEAPESGQQLVPLVEDERQNENTQIDERAAAASLLATKAAIKADAFARKTGATGKGQLVAVIDSGIDPGHPDLQTTTQNFKKMLDFIDLTDEGKVVLKDIKSSDGFLVLNEQKIDVSGIKNVNGVFKYGYFNLDFLPDKSGLASRKVLIVLSASKIGDEFDTAYFDTNDDGQVKDESPVQKYSRQQQIVKIKGDEDRSFNLVISEISNKDSYIRLGFDGLGHGTEVAGIVAAHGKVEGIAPDAQLLVLKIMDRTGTALLQKLESALSLAADRGASVAVVSLGQYTMSTSERESLAKTAALIWKTKSMIICMAAGNSGPGLGTVADTTGLNNIISVGAYATPEMWATDYGLQVPKPTLWYFSSVGPAREAATSPLLLAPGSAISTYPLWADSMYHQAEGTSIAAPHLAGAAALLLDANQHRLYNSDASAVYQVLLAGARPIKELQTVEQGLGAVDLLGAWEELRLKKAKTASAEASQYSPGNGLAPGLYTRGLTPASLSLHISNTGNTNTRFSLGGFADWIKPEQFSLQVPAHSERTVDINYGSLNEPGLYSSFLVADDYNSSGLDLALLQTVVIPYDMSKIKEVEQIGKLEPGYMKHYFFQVPVGSNQISFKLVINNGQGRARIDVIAPDGSHETSTYAGMGKDSNVTSANLSYSNPQSGIWEVVVYSSVSLCDYGLKESDYVLQATLDGKGSANVLLPDDRYFVSSVVSSITPGEKTHITLFFWSRGSKLPASGLVSIEGRLYEINNGMVSLSIIPREDTINLNLVW